MGMLLCHPLEGKLTKSKVNLEQDRFSKIFRYGRVKEGEFSINWGKVGSAGVIFHLIEPFPYMKSFFRRVVSLKKLGQLDSHGVQAQLEESLVFDDYVNNVCLG